MYKYILQMKKEKDILIRVNSELKEKIQEKAKLLGLSVSSFIRTILIREINNG